MKKTKTPNETTVGIFVVVGFVFLSLIVFFVSGVYLFRPGYTVEVMYDYVSILDKGAPVRMAGVRVGEVSGVELVFDEKLNQTRVRVKLFIEKGVEIRENYAFEIRGTHILSEPHIEISPKPGNEPFLKNMSFLEGESPVPVESLVERGHNIAKNLDDILTGLKEAVTDEESGQALKEILVNMARLTKSLDQMMSGSGKDVKQTIKHLNDSTAKLDKLLDAMSKGEGTVGKLVMQDELYQEMRAFVQEIKAHPWRLMKKDNGGRKFLFFLIQ